MKRIILLFLLAVALVSCGREVADMDFGGNVEVNFSLMMPEEVESRGFISSSTTEGSICCYALAAYSDGRLYAQRSGEDWRLVFLKLDGDKLYNLYFIVNYPGIVFPDNESELSDLAISYASVGQMGRCGLPAAASVLSYAPSPGTMTVALDRLVSKIIVSVENNDLAELNLKKAKICNAAAGVYPFADRTFDSVLDDFDFSDTELETLSTGKEIILYCLENKRGSISALSPKDKVPDNMSEAQRQYATYLEIDAEVSGRVSGTVHYRMYLGKNNTTDLNLCRSASYTLSVGLSQAALNGGCLEPYWKIDVSDITSVKLFGCHWVNNGGYFWDDDDWNLDDLYVDNALGQVEYTILASWDEDMEDVSFSRTYHSGEGDDLEMGEACLNLSFSDDHVHVEMTGFDVDVWWMIRVRDMSDGSIAVARIEQGGQSNLHLSYSQSIDLNDMYVGQSLTLEAIGQIDDPSLLRWEFTGDSSAVRLENSVNSRFCTLYFLEEAEFNIEAVYEGQRSEMMRVKVSKPRMELPAYTLLYMDGKDVNVTARYYSASGRPLRVEEFDPDLYEQLIRPLNLAVSGNIMEYVDLHNEPSSAIESSSYTDWKCCLKKVGDPDVLHGVITANNPAGCTANSIVAIRRPFSEFEPRNFGCIDNMLYLGGFKRYTSLTIAYPLVSKDAGDPENVFYGDESGCFIYETEDTPEDGKILKAISVNESALLQNPDLCGMVEVECKVRNRHSGELYVNPVKHMFELVLHVAIVMRVYSMDWPDRKAAWWFLTPCWYVPDKNYPAPPVGDIPSDVVAWNWANNHNFVMSSANNAVELSLDPNQIGSTVVNLSKRYGYISPSMFVSGQVLLKDMDDYDLCRWWEDDASRWMYSGKASFLGKTLDLSEAPGSFKHIIIHDFTKTLKY